MGLVIQNAEEAVVDLSPWAIDSYLIPAVHLTVHRFPVATAREPFGGSGSHRDYDRFDETYDFGR